MLKVLKTEEIVNFTHSKDFVNALNRKYPAEGV